MSSERRGQGRGGQGQGGQGRGGQGQGVVIWMPPLPPPPLTRCR